MSKARIGLIGAGWWGVEVYVPALIDHPDAELVAVNRRDRAALDRICEKFGIPNGYTDVGEMLAAEDLDAVVITSPHVVHFEHAKAALEAGCHVLIDKPMTTSAADAHALVALAEKVGKQILIPYGWNYKPFVTQAADLIAKGGVGEIRHVSCMMATFTYDLFGGHGLAEAKDAMFKPEASTWADPDRAGGYGWGQLSHSLGLMFRLVNLKPKEIYALETKSDSNVDLTESAVLTFENGAIASISGSALLPKQCSYQLDVRIYGTEGMLTIDMERTRMELRRMDKEDVVLDLEPDEGQYAAVEPINRLVQVCHGTAATIEADGTVGARAIDVLDAMYRSFKSSKSEAV
ncbi:Gfo/Idh/MocA family protein [Roseisalinus antarcticus]|uniref:Putative oxidoreductase YcjS n=1 Tax=Roseisalinus antarcticus TaxID=254357 RepID=A0A1Y5TIM9_9RHOB|nr:Gfo/Idh/MocA family oxidoreductase [Roseisalinus antarcticus]SLN64563.1 putative oxidoreductase YcjS [Roseisalinus antarcticus]